MRQVLYCVGISRISFHRILRYRSIDADYSHIDHPQCLHAEWYKSIETLNENLKFDPRNLTIQNWTPEVTSQDPSQKRKFSWWQDPKYFSRGMEIYPGVVDIAAIWFQAGHSVSQVSFACFRIYHGICRVGRLALRCPRHLRHLLWHGNGSKQIRDFSGSQPPCLQ